MAYRRVTLEIRAAVDRAITQGTGYVAIAARYGVSKSYVGARAQALGLARRQVPFGRVDPLMDQTADQGAPVCHCGAPLTFDSDPLTGRTTQSCPTHGWTWLVA